MGVTISFIPKLYPDNCFYIDMSGWDYMVVEPASGEVVPYITNDGGEITGSIENSAITATNFVLTSNFKALSTGINYSTNTMSDGDIYKMENIGRYVKLDGGLSAPEIIIMLYKKG